MEKDNNEETIAEELVVEEEKKEDKEDEAGITREQSDIAKKICKIIGDSDISLGKRDIASEHIRYKETAIKIMTLLMSKNVKYDEVDLLFQLVLQAISIAQRAVNGSLELSMRIALKNYWGKDTDLVTLQDIDAKMKPNG